MAAEGEIEDASSLRMASTYPRDLLRRFAGDESAKEASSGGGGGGGGLGEVELSLGLSLGGCFGEPKRERTPVEMATGMVRSSSISFPPMVSAAAAVARTCSLPVESEEERRRRKEMQSLKRMEAKRKRSEKRAKERRGEEERPAAAVAVAAVALMGPAKEEIGGKVKAKAASQGSIGSQGSSSSGVSDFDSRPGQGLDVSGLSNSTEARSPSTISSAPDNGNNKASPGRSANLSKEEEEPSKRRRIHTVRPNGVKETGKNMLEEMPCVSTKGDGPNGKRIEGFLYKYQKGEEVRIMCVCHGNFLTPAEFVKHAGGGDVDHPLRHIVVNPNPYALS